jgi:release factor glutamine methyltransferase
MKKFPISNIQFPINIIDIGTGSGCLVIAIAKKIKIKNKKLKIEFYATDISKKALKIAKQNAKLHKVDKKIKFLHGDLLKPILPLLTNSTSSTNLLILANLPYLPSNYYQQAPRNLRYEPKIALDGGKDGLNLYRRFFKQLSALVRISSAKIRVLIEIDPCQTKSIKQLVKKYLPQYQTSVNKDLAGKNRIVIIEN